MRQLACWLAQQADISRFKPHSICSEILRLLLGAKQDIAERVLAFCRLLVLGAPRAQGHFHGSYFMAIK